MNTQETIGKTLSKLQERDAVHIAVLSVIAGTNLAPGQHVGVEGNIALPKDKAIGIVDPYLIEGVAKGEIFWVFLYPNTITSLKHNWALPVLDNTSEIEEARKWLQDFAQTYGRNYADLIEEISNDNTFSAYGNDIYSWGELGEDADIFWKHLETVTGKRYDESYREKNLF